MPSYGNVVFCNWALRIIEGIFAMWDDSHICGGMEDGLFIIAGSARSTSECTEEELTELWRAYELGLLVLTEASISAIRTWLTGMLELRACRSARLVCTKWKTALNEVSGHGAMHHKWSKTTITTTQLFSSPATTRTRTTEHHT